MFDNFFLTDREFVLCVTARIRKGTALCRIRVRIVETESGRGRKDKSTDADKRARETDGRG